MFKPHSHIPRDDLLEAATILLFFMGSKEWISAENEEQVRKYFIQLNYSGIPPYGNLVNTATSLIQPPRYYHHFIQAQTKAQSLIFLSEEPL